MAINGTEPYPDELASASEDRPGYEQHVRAIHHRRRAVEAAQDADPAAVALTHALLALEARVDELTCYIAGAA